MYGSAFGWEWFVETVSHCELFPVIDRCKKVYTLHWLHIHVVINRRKDGKSGYRTGNTEQSQGN